MDSWRGGLWRAGGLVTAVLLSLLGPSSMVSATTSTPASGTITTLAGSDNNGLQATDTALRNVRDMVADATGNLFFSEGYGYVRRVSAQGILSTVTGNGISRHRGDGGPASLAEIQNPSGVAHDAAGNLFISDEGAGIRKVSTKGIITTAIGTGDHGFNGDGGPATEARVFGPAGLVTDGIGDLFIADATDRRLRKVGPDGVITTLAGNSQFGSLDDGLVASTGPLVVAAIAADAAGDAYLADPVRNTVRKVTPDGIIHSVAGSGAFGFSGDGGPAASAALNTVRSLTVDQAGNLYIADSANNRIRRVDTAGVITTVAGDGTAASTGDGGPATEAGVDTPLDIAADGEGNIFVYDLSGRIRKINAAGTITTFAGGGTSGFRGDGRPATEAQLLGPAAAVVDSVGNAYIADRDNNRVRRVASDGIITTYAGSGVAGFSGDGGRAVDAELSGPSGLAVDGQGNLYVSDYWNQRIRKVSPDGVITTVAGTGQVGFAGDGGPATAARFNGLWALAVDPSGNLFVSDSANQRIRRITPAGLITTVAGSGTQGFVKEGVPALDARFQYPRGVAADGHGNVFIADTGNGRIRKLSPDGIVRSVAGSGEQDPRLGQNDGGPPPGDGGPALAAPLDVAIYSVSVDPAGNLFFPEGLGATVRKVSPDGVISTVAGSGYKGFVGDGGPATSAYMYFPDAVALDGAGNLLVVEGGDAQLGGNRVRKVSGVAAAGPIVDEPYPAGLYHPLVPERILDTRAGIGGFSGPVGAQASIAVAVTGVGGVPSGGVSAVVVNLTVPERILDTRAGIGGFSGPVGAQASIAVAVTGVGGVPSAGVSAVVVNLTVTEPSAGSFLTVHPSDAARPNASNLNFVRGDTVANLVVAKVGADGKVRIYNNAGATHVVADVVGWYGAEGAPGGSS